MVDQCFVGLNIQLRDDTAHRFRRVYQLKFATSVMFKKSGRIVRKSVFMEQQILIRTKTTILMEMSHDLSTGVDDKVITVEMEEASHDDIVKSREYSLHFSQ